MPGSDVDLTASHAIQLNDDGEVVQHASGDHDHDFFSCD
jgi:hypothetical protein